MGKADLSPIGEAIAGPFNNRQYIGQLRIQDYAFNGFLYGINIAGCIGTARGTLIPSMIQG